jgi:hypothetical protein
MAVRVVWSILRELDLRQNKLFALPESMGDLDSLMPLGCFHLGLELVREFHQLFPELSVRMRG